MGICRGQTQLSASSPSEWTYSGAVYPPAACWVTSVMSDSLQPHDCSPPRSSVPDILQERILHWVVISSSRESSRLSDRMQVSYVFCIGRQVLYHPGGLEADFRKWVLMGHLCAFKSKSLEHSKYGLQDQRPRINSEELMLLNCGIGEDS